MADVRTERERLVEALVQRAANLETDAAWAERVRHDPNPPERHQFALVAAQFRGARKDLLAAADLLSEEGEPPVLHERADDGAWICCCGDHLSYPREPDGWISPVSVARLRDDATDDLTGVEVVKGRYRDHWLPVFIGPPVQPEEKEDG